MKKIIAIGDKFTLGNSKEVYLLCQTGESIVSLVGLNNANRWENGVHVKDIHNITKNEFAKITDSDDYVFIKVKEKCG
jgi:hypothetical protein